MTPRNASVTNAFDILRLIAQDGPKLSLAGIAKRLGLSHAATHRLVATLQEIGVVVRVKRNMYMPSPGLAEIVQTVDTTTILTGLARAPVKRLVKALGEVVHLATFDGEMVTYLVKGQPRRKASRTTVVPSQEGTQLEAYSSGVGKALLAYLPEDQLEKYIADAPFVALTDKTITDPGVMRKTLVQVRQQGYAMDDEEVMCGLTCLAVPLLSPSGRALASFSVSGATDIFTDDFANRARAALISEARLLETSLFGSLGGKDRPDRTQA